VIEQPWIKEIDINPLIASPERLLALDARVLLHPSTTPENELPKPSIRPYPTQYVDRWVSTGGDELTIRPIRPEDEPMLVDFHERLSERTVYQRFFSVMKLSQRVTHERLSRISFIDYDREMALVATMIDKETGERVMVGVGRLVKLTGGEAEFGLVVSDDYQRQGLGRELLKRLVDVGHDEKLKRIVGYILPDNTGMRHVAETLGFKLRNMPEENVIKAILDLE
jgi:acetyltransferase